MKSGLGICIVILWVSVSPNCQAQIQSNISFESYVDLIQEPKEEALSYLEELYAAFNAGKLKQSQFYFIVIIQDEAGKWEQVFIEVEEWEDGFILGMLASEMSVVEGPPLGAAFVFDEEKIVDWLVIDEDGREAGHFITRYLLGK